MRLIKSMSRYCTTLLAERVPYPLDHRRLAFDQERVEAALRLVAQAREVVTRGPDQLRALRRRDARGRAAESARCAPAYLDEDGRAAVASDEIDLTEPAAVIANEDGEAAALEECGGQRFRIHALRVHGRLSPRTVSLPP